MDEGRCRRGDRLLKVYKHMKAVHLFDDRLKTLSNLVQQDDALTAPHSQDFRDVPGLCTGYQKRALAGQVLVNEEATHEIPHGRLEYWSIGVLE